MPSDASVIAERRSSLAMPPPSEAALFLVTVLLRTRAVAARLAIPPPSAPAEFPAIVTPRRFNEVGIAAGDADPSLAIPPP